MNTDPRHFPLHTAGIAVFLVMSIFGWKLADGSRPSTPVSATSAQMGKRAERPERHARAAGPAAIAGQKLDPIRSAANPAARMSATVDLASSLAVSEFAGWLDGGFFTLREGPELTLFTKILFERWKQEDPEGLLAWSIKNNSHDGQTVIAMWSEKDPQRLLDFFKNHPHNAEEMHALQFIAANNPALALQRLLEMTASGASQHDANYSSGVVMRLAEKSPAALEATLDSLPPLLKLDAETALSGQRLKASFSIEIRALWDRPDGWTILVNNAGRNEEIGSKILGELANLPPAWRTQLASGSYNFIDKSNVQKWLDADLMGFGFDEYQVKQIQETALERLSYEQPELALQRMREFAVDQVSIHNVISGALSSANGNTDKMAALVASISSEDDRKVAQNMVDNSGSQSTLDLTTPVAWLEKLGSPDSQTGSSYAYFRILDDWDQDRIAALSTQFKSMPDAQKLQIAQILAAGGTEYGNAYPALTGEAIRCLVANSVTASENQEPQRTDPIEASSRYVAQLAVKDPTAAADWVQTLPAGDAKLWAEKNLAANWQQYDPKAAGQWVESLPADARDEVTKHLQKKR